MIELLEEARLGIFAQNEQMQADALNISLREECGLLLQKFGDSGRHGLLMASLYTSTAIVRKRSVPASWKYLYLNKLVDYQNNRVEVLIRSDTADVFHPDNGIKFYIGGLSEYLSLMREGGYIWKFASPHKATLQRTRQYLQVFELFKKEFRL